MKLTSPLTRRSFTLIELLVVIAIIAILISIILPLFRVRAALCSIAYVGKDLRLHVTTIQGGTDVDVAEANVFDTGGHFVVVEWSPSGDKIGFRTNTSHGNTCVLDPVTRHVSRFREPDYLAFRGWQDSRSLLQTDGSAMLVCDPRTGTVHEHLAPPLGVSASEITLARLPLTVNAHYIAMYTRTDGASGQSITCVHLLTKNLRPCKTIWEQEWPTLYQYGWPRVDPRGEYVAWTHQSATAGYEGIDIKNVADASSVRPTKIASKNFKFAVVCDWIDSNNLLVNASKVDNQPAGDWAHGGVWGLYIIDRRGNIVREISTPVPLYPSCVASYRQYGHQ